MNVLYLTQVFETGSDPGSDRHAFLCRYLYERGHRVTALTSNVDYKRATEKYPGAGWRVKKTVDGVEVWYVYSYPNFRGSFARRALYFLSYFIVTLLEGARLKKVDVVYAVSTPLTVGVAGYLLSRLYRVPFFFEVTDVWPDAAVAVGVVRNRLLIRLASAIERFCYRKASRIVALTAGIRKNIIQKGVPETKMLLITNGVDPALFRGAEEDSAAATRLRQEIGFGERLVCMYLGAHGKYNSLETLIEAAIELRDDERFIFVLVGDGDEKGPLEKLAGEQRLTNVQFLPPVARSRTPSLLGTADVFLLPNRRGAFFNMNLPNKLFDFLASSRPIVVAGEGESADLVRSAKAGLVVDAEDGKQLARALVEIAEMGAMEREAMGRRGRAYVLKVYVRDQLCAVLAEAIEAEAA